METGVSGRLKEQSLKKYSESITRKQGLRIVIIVILMLLASAVFLSSLSVRNMKRIIGDDFNSQQLELARHAAGILTDKFKILKRELTTLSLSPSIQYFEAVSWANRMKISFSTVKEYGVVQVMLISAEGNKAYSTTYNDSVFVKEGDYGKEDFFRWCRDLQNQGRIYVGDLGSGVIEESGLGFFKLVAVPVYQVSTDEAHPRPTHALSGVLAFVLDVSLFTRKVVAPIRSGKTGYAWVIDESGNFLYHLESDFIGENAFEVRKSKDPLISFTKISLIQKDKMLRGEEGTSWYISGWHRGKTGKMRKLIAYAPVPIGAANKERIWSVAVVAPISEVEDAVQGVYVRQALIQGVIIGAVVIVLVFFIAMERVWLRTLEHVVDEKTSDLQQYARRLRSSEERYRSLVESADDMIYTVNKDCKILSVNRYYRQVTGKEAEQVIGKNLTDVLRYGKPEKICGTVREVLETSETASHEEHAWIGNKEYWLDTKYKPIYTSSERVGAVLIIARDVTEHKSMEAQLFHAEKLASLGALSAGVAHEMNNPIAIILGFTEMLLEKFPEGSREHDILATIERQGNNCKRIIENLLTFARLPQKTTKDTDVVDDLQRVVNVVMNTLVNKKIDLKTDIDEDLPKVRVDSQQLEQVFLNIISNAAAAMDHGGILTIAAHRSDDTVHIDFRDTGPGISPEHMDKIFEPFFTTKKVGEGTGLGLSVSYGIVKKFGGEIRVKSEAGKDGKPRGTTFTLVLPIAGSEKRDPGHEIA
jgi:two-component system NtrC family sensor kinase